MVLMAVEPLMLPGAWYLAPMVPLNVRIFGTVIGLQVWMAVAAVTVALEARARVSTFAHSASAWAP
jgi:hypothetical protein